MSVLDGGGKGNDGEKSEWEDGEVLTNYEGLADGGGSKLSS
jgi:hypothetical protein